MWSLQNISQLRRRGMNKHLKQSNRQYWITTIRVFHRTLIVRQNCWWHGSLHMIPWTAMVSDELCQLRISSGGGRWGWGRWLKALQYAVSVVFGASDCRPVCWSVLENSLKTGGVWASQNEFAHTFPDSKYPRSISIRHRSDFFVEWLEHFRVACSHFSF